MSAAILSRKVRGRALYYDTRRRWTPWKFRAQHYANVKAAVAAALPLANALRASIGVEALKPKKKPTRKKKKPRRRNPATRSALRQAERLYTDFRGEGPRELLKVRLPKKPGALLTVGECTGIMYRTRRDGELDNYLHRFRKKARPTLAVGSDGRQLYLLGGAYSVTDAGIEDAA